MNGVTFLRFICFTNSLNCAYVAGMPSSIVPFMPSGPAALFSPFVSTSLSSVEPSPI